MKDECDRLLSRLFVSKFMILKLNFLRLFKDLRAVDTDSSKLFDMLDLSFFSTPVLENLSPRIMVLLASRLLSFCVRNLIRNTPVRSIRMILTMSLGGLLWSF